MVMKMCIQIGSRTLIGCLATSCLLVQFNSHFLKIAATTSKKKTIAVMLFRHCISSNKLIELKYVFAIKMQSIDLNISCFDVNQN